MIKIQKFFLKFKIIEVILGLAIFIFVSLFSYLSIRRNRTLNSFYYDLGIMNQVVYNTSQGRFLEMTNPDLKRNVSRLAIHFDPILAIFAPLYKIYSGPEVLLIGQSLILGLGALAVFLISEKILKKKYVSLIFSLAYLSYFAVQRALLFDFHGVVLATTFFLFAIYFHEIKKWIWFYIFIFLALMTKEHVGLVVLFFGFYLFFIKKEKLNGLITSAMGLFFFIMTVYVIIPYFRGGEHFASDYFVDISIRLPKIWDNGVNYVKMLIAPNIYSIFSPLTLLISLPELAINILSINNNQRSFFFHYNSVIVAFLFYSTILGYKYLDSILKSKVFKNIIFIIFIYLALRSTYLYNPTPFFVRYPVKYRKLNTITENSLKVWTEKLKNENLKISTTPKLAPFFTSRRTYHNFLYDSAFTTYGKTVDDIITTIDDYKIADYVIIYRPEIGDIKKTDNLSVKFYSRLLNDKNYQMIYTDDLGDKSLEVFKKIINDK